MFGDSYPADQIQDDFENYRPLEMIHADYSFRHRIWKLASAEQSGEICKDTAGSIWNDLILHGEARVSLDKDVFAELTLVI